MFRGGDATSIVCARATQRSSRIAQHACVWLTSLSKRVRGGMIVGISPVRATKSVDKCIARMSTPVTPSSPAPAQHLCHSRPTSVQRPYDIRVAVVQCPRNTLAACVELPCRAHNHIPTSHHHPARRRPLPLATPEQSAARADQRNKKIDSVCGTHESR